MTELLPCRRAGRARWPHWLAASACAFSLLSAQATELNLANQAELEQLPGIGPQLAQRLLDERSQQGPFASWAEVQRRIKGVGPATARRLSRGGLRVAGQAYADSSSPAASGASAATAAAAPAASAP